MNQTVLIVEDDERIGTLLADYVRNAGYEARVIERGDEAVTAVRASPPDLILLDVMLPGLDGLEVCRQVRSHSDVPIIMITARVEEIDRILGLELGADDYVCKPFSPREVIARVRALLRRAGGKTQASAPVLIVDREGRTVRAQGKALPLTPTEFAILATLVEHPGRVYSRDQLMDVAYDDYRVVGDRTIDTHVRNVRGKLADAFPDREMLRSIYGVGYKYEP